MDDITLKEYYEIFTSAWKLFREFRNLKTDEDRDRLRDEGAILYKKYPNWLMYDLVWAVINELNRRAGNGKEKAMHTAERE